MTSITWKGGDGEFGDGSRWSTGNVPGSSDNALITAPGTYTVTTYDPFEVGSLTLASGATLDVDVEGQFLNEASVDSGLTNRGTINLGVDELFNIGLKTTDQLTVTNSGTIAGAAEIVFYCNTTKITGGGNIVLSDGSINGNLMFFVSARPYDATIENVDNTISGAGSIVSAFIVNDAGGTIVGNVANDALVLKTGHQISNAGILVASNLDQDNPGVLQVDDGVNNTGLIEAINGATVDLNGATNVILNHAGTTSGSLYATQDSTIVVSDTVQGGNITTDEQGEIYVTGGTFDGSSAAVDLNADVVVDSGNALTLLGQINNSGSINLTAGDLIVNPGTTTLGGGGAINLTSNSNIRSSGNAASLVNGDNTIDGSGELGDGRLVLINHGTINANLSDPLLVSSGAGSVNAGLAEATGGGTLEFVRGAITNTGTIAAGSQLDGMADGSAVEFFNNTVANNVNGVLTDGTWEAFLGDTLSLTGGAITTIAANVELFGAGSMLVAGNGLAQAPLEQSLVAIATGGKLFLEFRDFTTGNAIALDGTLQLGGSTFSSDLITGSAGSFLIGNGTVVSVVNDAGSVGPGIGSIEFTAQGNQFSGALFSAKTSLFDFAAGSDTLSKGASMGAGNYAISAGATLTVGSSVSCAGQIVETGALIIAKGTFDVSGVNSLTNHGSVFSGVVSGAGTLELGGGVASIDAGATLTIARVLLAGHVNVALEESLTYAGAFTQNPGTTLTITAAQSLTLSGASAISGTIELLGGSAAGKTMFTDSGAITGTGTIKLNANAIASLGGPIGSAETITFKGSGSTLVLHDPMAFAGQVTGFAKGDVLDLSEKVKSVSHTSSTLTVTLSDGSQQTFNLTGTYTGLALKGDGAGGSDITATSKNAAAAVPAGAGRGGAVAGRAGAAAPGAGSADAAHHLGGDAPLGHIFRDAAHPGDQISSSVFAGGDLHHFSFHAGASWPLTPHLSGELHLEHAAMA